ncbi:MAG: DUF3570 domain-containing protein [Minicystis sp.]
MPALVLFLVLMITLTGSTAAHAGGPGDALVGQVAAEVGVYADTNTTTCVTPVVSAKVENVLSGWGVSGSFAVDVVSTASADIVATASPRWRELRYAPALGGHHRFGDADVALRASLSSEPDYLSVAGGGTFSIDLAGKTVTPGVSYDFAHDTLGRAGTPFSLFSRPIQRHSLAAGVALVLGKSTLFIPTLSAQFEIGDTSKPYRHVPMFGAAAADAVTPGMSAADVDAIRLDLRPLEQLPKQRQRWALDAVLLHRFARSTLRLEERLYQDTWGLRASTTDARVLFDVGEHLRLGTHARLHAQTAVSFWQLAYVARSTSQGLLVPALRTGARELGPLVTPTGGLDLRIPIGPGRRLALTLGGEVGYTRFLDHLFIRDRVSFLGTTMMEAEL